MSILCFIVSTSASDNSTHRENGENFYLKFEEIRMDKKVSIACVAFTGIAIILLFIYIINFKSRRESDLVKLWG